MMLIKCLRKDRLYPSIRRFISLTFNNQYLQLPLIHLHDMPSKSSAQQPIIVIRCDSTEPVHMIEKLASNSRVVTLAGRWNEVTNRTKHLCIILNFRFIINRQSHYNSMTICPMDDH